MANVQKFTEVALGRPGRIMVKFGAPWCGPCQSVAPTLEAMAEEGAAVFDVNTDEDQDSAIKYGIRGVPTFILFEDGKEVKRTSGAQTKAALTKFMEE
jgi:thioredoxin 1